MQDAGIFTFGGLLFECVCCFVTTLSPRQKAAASSYSLSFPSFFMKLRDLLFVVMGTVNSTTTMQILKSSTTLRNRTSPSLLNSPPNSEHFLPSSHHRPFVRPRSEGSTHLENIPL